MISSKHHSTGFTLIEMMITVAIVGILAAIAYPSYTAQVQKSRRADAQVALMEIMQRQESYFLRTRSYTSDLTDLGYAVDANGKATSNDRHYLLSATATASTFSITAEPVSGQPQAQDAACQVMKIDNRGVKRGGVDETHADADTAQTCWK
jgi:type IV pilus assembly protein PilE